MNVIHLGLGVDGQHILSSKHIRGCDGLLGQKKVCSQRGCCKPEGIQKEVCCCIGDRLVKVLMDPSHYTFPLLFRCNVETSCMDQSG